MASNHYKNIVTMDKLKREIPEYMIKPYRILESSLPTIIDFCPNGYADGKDKRRARREQERKNKRK